MDHLKTRFTKLPDRSIELPQLRMIERVLQIVGLDDVSNCTKNALYAGYQHYFVG